MRNRSEPSQVAQAGFEPERIAVTQRVIGCYCASARAGDSGGSAKSGVSQTKDAERRDKVSARNREGHEAWAGPVKTFRNAGDVKNDTAGPVSERQPESEEARPVARGERAVKSGG